MKQQINEIRRMQQLAGIISESQLNEEGETFQQFATKIANQHQLHMIPQPTDKSTLNKMFTQVKGDFKGKLGVIAFEPSISVIYVLSTDKKINDVVYAQFKQEWGGNDSGYEEQGWYVDQEGKGGSFQYDGKVPTFEGAKPAYFKSFKVKTQK